MSRCQIARNLRGLFPAHKAQLSPLRMQRRLLNQHWCRILLSLSLCLPLELGRAADQDLKPAQQHFIQIVPRHFTELDGLPAGKAQLLDLSSDGTVRALTHGQWYRLVENVWKPDDALRSDTAVAFNFHDQTGQPSELPNSALDVK